ncbi:peptidylprolyl isomerase [Synechococcus sp. PCC 6312]|uniref:peptidylprolyl isomerase n=1 Tax=Synechococcus sp. (strain ATCC 27167 / PCC 6312) TaxID=195253 RepID=UPI00029F0088|nr:peptidylprolyl isomerase [Synechococcus sp. PCC 6312]AFY61048.1 peptidyl-prolyl cis-trans isomerase (rotamase) - cyclophilin family [Synechococcus sp. PCC 6312]
MNFQAWYQSLSRFLAVVICGVFLWGLGLGVMSNGAWARGWENLQLIAALPQGNAVTDAKAILRNALPIDNPTVRELQGNLEDISNQLRAKRWSGVGGDIKKAKRLLETKTDKLLASIPTDSQPQAKDHLEQLNQTLDALQTAAEAKDRQQLLPLKAQALDQVGRLEDLMVKGFPFQIPAEYRNLPQLLGRATVKLTTSKGDITVVLDGYSAPVTAGNFVDLVKRGFYNQLPFTRAEESYVLQAGDPPGPEDGFIDPKTKEYRAIPLEILTDGDNTPLYGITLEDAGRYLEHPVLPFSAYGTLALARPNEDANGGSSQFFFLLFEPELTPAGLNLLDGRYAVFGYTVDGQDVLGKLRPGDMIEKAEVIAGGENLVL